MIFVEVKRIDTKHFYNELTYFQFIVNITQDRLRLTNVDVDKERHKTVNINTKIILRAIQMSPNVT